MVKFISPRVVGEKSIEEWYINCGWDTDANAKMAEINYRLPAILKADEWLFWLRELEKGDAILMRPVLDIA